MSLRAQCHGTTVYKLVSNLENMLSVSPKSVSQVYYPAVLSTVYFMCDHLYYTVQLFPLLMVTYHEHGGYRMDSSEIGVVLMVVGVFQLLWQVRSIVISCCMYWHMETACGPTRTAMAGDVAARL